MKENRFDLSALDWELKGTDSYVPLLRNSMETGKELKGITGWIPAKVPGGVHLALYREGLIEHPYYGMNSLRAEWVENRWWIYRTSFSKPALNGETYHLVFHGVDYECMVYLNDVCLGEHKGMYEPFSFDITDQMAECENFTLQVLIKHAPDEMGQIGKTSLTSTQKSRFNYKWDFSTRLVNLGIWREVELVGKPAVTLENLHLRSTVLDSGAGRLTVSGTIQGPNGKKPAGYSVRTRCGLDGEEAGQASLRLEEQVFTLSMDVKHPALWNPNGMGAQPLYDVTMELLWDGKVVDAKAWKQGIRKLEYRQNTGGSPDSLPYTFVVNGNPLYIKGVNLTPLDHIYGDIPEAHYRHMLEMAADMGCNMIRIWGGGLIESEALYRICDQLGLLVWQEFIQSSSGVDNTPAKDPAFLALLERSARAALREKRSYTCLAVWSGGNELMDEQDKPVTLEDENIAMLAGLAKEYDPDRMFLPGSPSGPGKHLTSPGESHDVHGWWEYQGNPIHYSFYGGSDSLFHSEFGCNGMSDLVALQKFLPPHELRPAPMAGNDMWRFHGDWWCTYQREQSMFGTINELLPFIQCSQWMQTEGLRTILEYNRIRQPRNSGSIIWQINEPWPNISCTSLVSYYGDPKMAFYGAKQAFAPVCAVLKYPKLDYSPGEPFSGRLFLLADSMVETGSVTIGIAVLDMHGKVHYTASQTTEPVPMGVVELKPLQFEMWDMPLALCFVRLTCTGQHGNDSKLYVFGNQTGTPYAGVLSLEEARLELELVSGTIDNGTYRVKNTGKAVALHVRLYDASDRFHLFCRDNYFSLFPGESVEVPVKARRRFSFGFDEYRDLPEGCQPDIRLSCIGEKRISQE